MIREVEKMKKYEKYELKIVLLNINEIVRVSIEKDEYSENELPIFDID